MNGIDYLADTNAILYFLSGNNCMKPYKFSSFAFSIISEMELLSYSGITDSEEERIQEFLSKSSAISITPAIKNLTIQLRRKYNIKLPDAIIAATSIANDLPLITADIGFKRISELKLIFIQPDLSGKSI